MNADLTKVLLAMLAILVLAAAALVVMGFVVGVRGLRPRGRSGPPKGQVDDPWGLNLPRQRRGAADPVERDESPESSDG
jgi:hypothetical protein